MRIMDLPCWPPQAGGTFIPSKEFLVSAKDLFVERVVRISVGHITFACRYKDQPEFYDFFVADENTSKKVVRALTDHQGSRLFDIGLLEISPDES